MPRRLTELPPHGTRTRYHGTRITPACHCDECRDANTKYQARYRSVGPITRRRTRDEWGNPLPPRRHRRAPQPDEWGDPTYGGLIPA